MRFGIEVVPLGEYTDPRPVVELAVAAEAAGWEALSIWDHVNFPGGVGDPWVTLTAVATATTRIRLLVGVAPLPRYQPYHLARTLRALDLVSDGRVVLGAGLGVVEEFAAIGEETDTRVRAGRTDEALPLVARLCAGGPVDHDGEHFHLTGVQVAPPGGRPRVPVWIGGLSDPALRRAARWDGWTAYTIDENQRVLLPPERLAERVAVLTAAREDAAREDAARRIGGHPFEVAVNGTSPAGGAGLSVEYAQAGASWWFESLFGLRGSHSAMLERVAAGPPR